MMMMKIFQQCCSQSKEAVKVSRPTMNVDYFYVNTFEYFIRFFVIVLKTK